MKVTGTGRGPELFVLPANDLTTSPQVEGETARKAVEFAAHLRKAMETKDQAELRKATQEMEAFFLSLLWREMRATIPRSGLFPRGLAEDIFEEMLDQAYAQAMAKAGGLGLADILYRQLSGELEETSQNKQDKGVRPRNTEGDEDHK